MAAAKGERMSADSNLGDSFEDYVLPPEPPADYGDFSDFRDFGDFAGNGGGSARFEGNNRRGGKYSNYNLSLIHISEPTRPY